MNRFAMAQEATRRQTKRSASTHDAAFREKRACWILVALCVLAYLPNMVAALAGGLPFGEDAAALFGPWREYSKAALSDGVLPLWNSRVFCGLPFLPNAQTSVLYPPNVVYWIFPLPIALLLDAIGHNIVLALGAFTLARALGISKSGAFVTACALGLSGAVAAHANAGHTTWSAARAYIPWELWALLLYLRGSEYSGRHSRNFYLVLLAVLFALQFYAGYPPLVLLGGGMCVGLFMAYAVSTRRWHWWWLGGAAFLAFFTMLLTAAVLLPMREVSQMSSHGTGLPFRVASIGSGNWKSLFRLLSPDYFGGNTTQWSINIGAWEEAAYGGVLTLALALGALWLARKPDGKYPRAVPWLAALLPFSVLLAMGKNLPVYGWLYEAFAVFRITRVPVRWLEVWAFAAALLAGFAFDGLWQSGSPHARSAAIKKLRAIFFGLLVGAGMALVWALSQYGNGTPWLMLAQFALPEGSRAEIAQTTDFLRQRALLESLGTLILLILLVRYAAHRKARVLLPALLAADVVFVFWKSAQPLWRDDVTRLVTWPSSLTRYARENERWTTNVAFLANNNNMQHGPDGADGYDALSGNPHEVLVSAVEQKKMWASLYGPFVPNPILKIFGVTHMMAQRQPQVFWKNRAMMKLVGQDGEWQLWRYDWQAWPREYITTRVLSAPTEKQLAFLQPPAEENLKDNFPVALEPQQASLFPTLQAPAAAPRVLSVQRTWSRTRVELQTDVPAVFVQSDILYPGWQAAIDGHAAPLWVANGVFRGVPLEAGARHLEIIYNSQTLRFGLYLTMVALALLAALTRTQSQKKNGKEGECSADDG